jgi:hypothetical protein
MIVQSWPVRKVRYLSLVPLWLQPIFAASQPSLNFRSASRLVKIQDTHLYDYKVFLFFHKVHTRALDLAATLLRPQFPAELSSSEYQPIPSPKTKRKPGQHRRKLAKRER